MPALSLKRAAKAAFHGLDSKAPSPRAVQDYAESVEAALRAAGFITEDKIWRQKDNFDVVGLSYPSSGSEDPFFMLQARANVEPRVVSESAKIKIIFSQKGIEFGEGQGMADAMQDDMGVLRPIRWSNREQLITAVTQWALNNATQKTANNILPPKARGAEPLVLKAA